MSLSPFYKPNFESLMNVNFSGKLMGNRVMNDLILKKNQEIWVSNLKSNFRYKSQYSPIKVEFGKWVGKEVLVVGAGPSAFENIDYIKSQFINGTRIIAVDRIYQFLKDNGVIPHFTVSVDPNPVCAEYLGGASSNENLVLSPIQDPSVFESKAQIYMYLPIIQQSEFWLNLYNMTWKKFFNLRGMIVVTGVAIDLALWMGSHVIKVIGNELSWPRQDEVYPGYDMNEFNIVVKFVNGKKRVTSATFLEAAKCISRYPQTYSLVKWMDLSDGIMFGWPSFLANQLGAA